MPDLPIEYQELLAEISSNTHALADMLAQAQLPGELHDMIIALELTTQAVRSLKSGLVKHMSPCPHYYQRP